MTQPSTLDTFNLTGRCALVTGGSRGIGRSIALALAEAGADVAVACESNAALAEEVAAAVGALGRRSAAIRATLATDEGVAQTADAALAALGRVDILVLNASLQLPTPWREVTGEQFDAQVAVNLRASLWLAQRLTPAMAERGWGRVLAVGSVQERAPVADMLVYAATKSAQESMVRNLAKQLAPRGVTVNNLAPGVIDTDRNRDRLVDPARRAKVVGHIPLGRLGTPDDCAAAALLLCSDAGRYITGQTLFVDGGYTL